MNHSQANRRISDVITHVAKNTEVKEPANLRRSNHRRRYIIVLTVICILATVAVGTIVWHSSRPDYTDDIARLKTAIGRHYVLPNNEEPVLLTVTDKKQITTDFLKIAEDGDRVLIYQNSKRVIIYRPSIDKIVDVGPVVVASDGQTPQAN